MNSTIVKLNIGLVFLYYVLFAILKCKKVIVITDFFSKENSKDFNYPSLFLLVFDPTSKIIIHKYE